MHLSAEMPMPPFPKYAVALQGFSDFERSALAAFFRLASQRTPSYVQVASAEQSDFLIADAGRPAALAAVLACGRSADTVFIGGTAPAQCAAWLPRPIVPLQIVRRLDLLVAQRLAVPPGFSAPLALELAPAAEASSFAFEPALTAATGGAGRDVLVVEDSAVARKFLMLRLQRLGYSAHDARGGDEAIEKISRMSFAIVFADVVLGPPGSIDGLQVCQYVKQHQAHPDAPQAAVVMVTGLGGSHDRVLGALAGCDAYLLKPLHEGAFIAALRKVDPAFNWKAAKAARSPA